MLVAEYFAFQAFMAATDGAVQVSKPAIALAEPVVVTGGAGLPVTAGVGFGLPGVGLAGVGLAGLVVEPPIGIGVSETFGVTLGAGALGVTVEVAWGAIQGSGAEFGLDEEAGAGTFHAVKGPVEEPWLAGQVGLLAWYMAGCRASPTLAVVLAVTSRTEASACAETLRSLP